jgi:DNA-binding transcriptional ArsR family regulator
LRAIAAVELAKAADPDMFRSAFVAHAKQWANAEGVPASAFRSMGVPADVLAAAGLDGGQRRRRGKAKAQPSAGTRTRRPSVKADQLEQGVLGMSGEFTIKDVVDQVGGSQLTVRTTLDRLEAQGKVTTAGERSGGRGRAAKTWKVA